MFILIKETVYMPLVHSKEGFTAFGKIKSFGTYNTAVWDAMEILF